MILTTILLVLAVNIQSECYWFVKNRKKIILTLSEKMIIHAISKLEWISRNNAEELWEFSFEFGTKQTKFTYSSAENPL